MALILSQLDNGNGIMDRFLMLVPNSVRPLTQEQMLGKEQLSTLPFQEITDLYTPFTNIDKSNPPQFYFSSDAQRYDYLFC